MHCQACVSHPIEPIIPSRCVPIIGCYDGWHPWHAPRLIANMSSMAPICQANDAHGEGPDDVSIERVASEVELLCMCEHLCPIGLDLPYVVKALQRQSLVSRHVPLPLS